MWNVDWFIVVQAQFNFKDLSELVEYVVDDIGDSCSLDYF